MTPLLYAELFARAGLPLVQQLFAMISAGNKPLTEADFALLDEVGKYRSTDALTAAGIKIVDGRVVPL